MDDAEAINGPALMDLSSDLSEHAQSHLLVRFVFEVTNAPTGRLLANDAVESDDGSGCTAKHSPDERAGINRFAHELEDILLLSSAHRWKKRQGVSRLQRSLRRSVPFVESNQQASAQIAERGEPTVHLLESLSHGSRSRELQLIFGRAREFATAGEESNLHSDHRHSPPPNECARRGTSRDQWR
jgi:hypothetical protein